MSTSTASFSPFMAPSVEKVLPLACLGRVSEVKPGKITEKGIYSMIQVVIEPYESGKKDYVNFLFRPEWLEAGFNPDTIKEFEGGDKMLAVYRMHISCTQPNASNKNADFELNTTLAGLAGSEAAYYQLSGQIMAIEGEKTPEAVQAVLSSFIKAEQEDGRGDVGYLLRQKQVEVGTDENGKKVKELVDGYEHSRFFTPDAKGKGKIAKQAATGKLILGFEA